MSSNLSAVVRAPGPHYLFGSSGPPVESLPEALRLVRALGFTGTGSRLVDRLQQGTTRVTRAFCMPEQWVPVGARVSVRFHVPLAASAPVFTIDWNGDGRIDSLGPFRPGGARIPLSDRC